MLKAIKIIEFKKEIKFLLGQVAKLIIGRIQSFRKLFTKYEKPDKMQVSTEQNSYQYNQMKVAKC